MQQYAKFKHSPQVSLPEARSCQVTLNNYREYRGTYTSSFVERAQC